MFFKNKAIRGPVKKIIKSFTLDLCSFSDAIAFYLGREHENKPTFENRFLLKKSRKLGLTLELIPNLDSLLLPFSTAFNSSSYERFRTLVVGAILAPRRRTIAAILRSSGEMANRHYSSYHRFFSEPSWDPWELSWVLAKLILLLIPRGTVRLLIDDTTCRRWGPKVFEKGCHRDAARSTKNLVVYCFGHKWVTLCILVPLPFTNRPWCLPVAALLYKKRKENGKESEARTGHRTYEDLARILIYKIIRHFPDRHFEVVGDGGYSSSELSNFCAKMSSKLISRLRKDSVLYDKPKPSGQGQRGRPRKKGERQASFKDKIEEAKPEDWTEEEVIWYGGQTKRVRWLSGTGLRYKPKAALRTIKWVIVQELGTDHWDCFFSTGVQDSPKYIIEAYVSRWTIEVTYQEAREHLGLETAKNWCKNSIERTVPCLLGLFSLVTLSFEKVCQVSKPSPQGSSWYKKTDLTFSDAMFTVRKGLWARLLLFDSAREGSVVKIPYSRWEFINNRLSATG